MQDDATPLRLFRPLLLLVLGLLIAALALSLLTSLRDTRRADLAAVEQWTYQLQGFAGDRQRVAASESDMLVIDYAIDEGSGLRPLTTAEVARLKKKPDGSRRLVVAYFSVGEAEEYRPYWQAAWLKDKPSWLVAENCRWPKNHIVRFWEPGWRDIVFAGKSSYLAAIQDAGFDGVYLDRVDVYADVADRFPDARQRMIAFIGDLATAARARDPGFLVLVQNAEELLQDKGYRAVIDSVAKEDLIHGVNGTGRRNPDDMISGSVELLDTLKAEGKPIFAVEYLTSRAAIDEARRELARRGYVGVFPTRALDGGDPVKSAGSMASAASPETGTPEYAAAKCDGVWHRATPGLEPASPSPAAPPPSAAM